MQNYGGNVKYFIVIFNYFLIFQNTLLYSCDNIEIHKKIVDNILKHEGQEVLKTKYEYSKYGVKSSVLKEYNKKYKLNYKIDNLSKSEASEIDLELMKEHKIMGIERYDLKLVVYDVFYNMGPRAGATTSQRTLNKYPKEDQFPIVEDGIFGSETIRTLNQVVDLRKFIKIFTEERLNYYFDLKNWEPNKKGWLKRINSFFELKDLECKK